jgi:multicomponent Na+:H+ antiporter subunit G
VSVVLDVATVVLAVVGALLALVAAVGLHRLGDTRSRMHAATKPATLGVLCCGVAATLQLDDVSSVTKLAVIVALQLVTAPVGAHMLARALTLRDDASRTER